MNKIQLLTFLKSKFGFDNFKTGQLEVIQALLDKKDTLSVLSTGGGKSLIYQFFGQVTQKRVLVVSPLIALMQDQVSRMNYLGFKNAIAINSYIDFNQKKYLIDRLENYQYIFISPEMLSNQSVKDKLKTLDIGLFVVDEAHCISQWGPDFRPEYLSLGKVKSELKNPLTLLLTATADDVTRNDILDKMDFKHDEVLQIINSINRENIFINCQEVDDENDKNAQLLKLVNQINGAGIVYFSSKSQSDKISDLINENSNRKSMPYHADMDNEQRYKIQQQFMNDKIDIICATSAFGMGIDKNNIRFVIHYHFPANIQDYFQEIGRAGRDGQPSISILLFNYYDINIHRNLLFKNFPDDDLIKYFWKNPKIANQFNDDQSRLLKYYYDNHYSMNEVIEIFAQRKLKKEQQLGQMIDFIQTKACRRDWLLNYFGEAKIRDVNFCCDNDSALNDYFEKNNSLVDLEKNKVELIDWKEKLNRLILLKN